jgi:hypothetical protein
MRPDPPHDPSVELIEELSDVGSFVIFAPSPQKWVKFCNQLLPFPVASRFEHRLDKAKHSAIRYSLGDQREKFFVIHRPEGTYDTLPIIRTFPRESRLSVLFIRSRVNHSLFLRPSIGTVDCISF